MGVFWKGQDAKVWSQEPIYAFTSSEQHVFCGQELDLVTNADKYDECSSGRYREYRMQ